MNKKTIRKNNSNLEVNWPSSNEFWTIKDLHKNNPKFVEITLRVRVANAINKHNTVAVIGDKKNSKGRPEMVCALRRGDGSIDPQTIESAKQAGIRCDEVYSSVVTNINPTPIDKVEKQIKTTPIEVNSEASALI